MERVVRVGITGPPDALGVLVARGVAPAEVSGLLARAVLGVLRETFRHDPEGVVLFCKADGGTVDLCACSLVRARSVAGAVFALPGRPCLATGRLEGLCEGALLACAEHARTLAEQDALLGAPYGSSLREIVAAAHAKGGGFTCPPGSFRYDDSAQKVDASRDTLVGINAEDIVVFVESRAQTAPRGLAAKRTLGIFKGERRAVVPLDELACGIWEPGREDLLPRSTHP